MPADLTPAEIDRLLAICEVERRLTREEGVAALLALQAERVLADRLAARVEAVEQLLSCYRLGRSPSEKLHRDLERSKQALAEHRAARQREA